MSGSRRGDRKQRTSIGEVRERGGGREEGCNNSRMIPEIDRICHAIEYMTRVLSRDVAVRAEISVGASNFKFVV